MVVLSMSSSLMGAISDSEDDLVSQSNAEASDSETNARMCVHFNYHAF